MGFSIDVPEKPVRIVSLVPSLTELLCDLGLENRLCGVTKFCVHPKEVISQKTKVGGTKTFHIEAIKALNPDLIIANKEENDEERILKLKQHFPVWISVVETLDDCLKTIQEIGDMTGSRQNAGRISEKIRRGFSEIPVHPGKLRAAYLIWRRPYMSINRSTFIHDIMERCGLENVFAGEESRYPEISAGQLKEADPQVVLLSSEPYPFSEKHFEEIKQLLPGCTAVLVDGEMFSWYGSRMMFAPAYLMKLRDEVILPLSKA